MTTPTVTDQTNRNDRLESYGNRLKFIAMEWSLIIGWLMTLLVIWRVTFMTLAERFLPLSAVRLAVIFGVLFLTIGCVAALAITGFWLRMHPYTETTRKRWLKGIVWLGSAAAIGRLLVWLLVEGVVG